MNCKLILEMGCNHQGEMSIAKKLIEKAAELGVYGVKFQKRDIDGHPEWKLKERDPAKSFGKNYYDHRKALEFSIKDLQFLRDYAHSYNLVFGVTAFDIKSAKDIYQIEADYIKLPSQHYSNYALNREVFDNGIEVHGSTGMHTISEVLDWQYINDFDVLYYCRSIYPCHLDDLNFENMQRISESLTVTQVLGYSSHEIEGLGIPTAVLLGAKYIERHFTLDNSMKGSDHSTVSSDPEEIRGIIEAIETAEEVIEYRSDIPDAEKQVRKIYRGF